MIRGYDARQYSLLQQRLEEFVKELIPLPKLINDVEALLLVLQSPDPDWLKGFLEYWMEPEITYAYTLDQGNPVPNYVAPDIKKVVDSMLLELSKISYLIEDDE